MSDLEEMFKDLERCCLHDPQWRPADVDRELRWIGDRQTGSDSSAIVIVRLKPVDGKRPEFGLLAESEDYTGHGCQCSSMTAKEPTLIKLLSHLDEYELAQVVTP